MEVKDKVTIITGASAGIGLAAARLFAQQGAQAVLAARSADKLEETAAELRRQGYQATAIPTDMTDEAQVKALAAQVLQRYGRIDILINNAGQAVAGSVAEVNLEHLRQVLELNVFGPLYAIQAVVPAMRQAGGGVIVNISSMTSKMHIPGLAAYAATKSALNMLSETARAELEGDHIRVITVYPRMTATDFGKNSLGNREMRQRQRTGSPAPVDSAEHVAGKILEAVREEVAEKYME